MTTGSALWLNPIVWTANPDRIIEAIDAGQFLVPRMSRPQMEAAIREPLKLASAIIRQRSCSGY